MRLIRGEVGFVDAQYIEGLITEAVEASSRVDGISCDV